MPAASKFSSQVEMPRLRRRVAQALAVAGAWAAVALVSALFGHVVAERRGVPQPWWPSLGYSLAIFSVWALLTAPLGVFVRLIEERVDELLRRLTLYALGLPVAWILHVFAFAAIYWPVYNDGGRIPDRWAMGERMLLANLHTDALFYALLVGGFAVTFRHRADPGERPNAGSPPEADEPLVIRSRGGFVRVPLEAVDRIEAAGDYCEVRAGGAVHLIDESLASLAARLPARRFARIHRGAIVPLERVLEVRGVGRGDAVVRLADGGELRLSRRYRHEFEARLGGQRPLVG